MDDVESIGMIHEHTKETTGSFSINSGGDQPFMLQKHAYDQS